MEKLYTIGDAAAELGMPASTIRFYEKNGLIPNQQRSTDGRRLFDESVPVTRLELVDSTITPVGNAILTYRLRGE